MGVSIYLETNDRLEAVALSVDGKGRFAYLQIGDCQIHLPGYGAECAAIARAISAEFLRAAEQVEIPVAAEAEKVSA